MSFDALLQDEIRRFAFPLNAYAELLRLDTGTVDYLHYGLFDTPGEPVKAAQSRSTEWLFGQLPAPCRMLEVGIGLGTTLDRLQRAGFQAHGVTPDAGQIRIAQARNAAVALTEARFEEYAATEPFDLLLFQESSQYIENHALWHQAAKLVAEHGRVMVLDEFRSGGDGHLHRLDDFLAAAAEAGFKLDAQHDFSQAAAPTVDYLLGAVDQHWATLAALPGASEEALHALQASNRQYRAWYADGSYRYLYLGFSRTAL